MIQNLTDAQIRLIRALQDDFPLCPRPFEAIGKRVGMSEDQVITAVGQLRQGSALRRIAATLNHNFAGYAINSMLVWDVPEDRLDDAAGAAARFPQVTHCYARQRDPEFDYNLYTMVHETSEAALEALISTLQTCIQPDKWLSLRTLHELKKTGMRFFEEKD